MMIGLERRDMTKSKKDFVRMVQGNDWAWYWEIITYNGHYICSSEDYLNKAQCRNVGKKFAQRNGLEWRE